MTHTHRAPNLMNPKSKTPSVEELFEKTLSVHILTSRWGRYIGIGSVGLRPSDFIRYNETLVHHDPNKQLLGVVPASEGYFQDAGILGEANHERRVPALDRQCSDRCVSRHSVC